MSTGTCWRDAQWSSVDSEGTATHIAQHAGKEAHAADRAERARPAHPGGPPAREELDPALGGEALDEDEHEEGEGEERKWEARDGLRDRREDGRELGYSSEEG